MVKGVSGQRESNPLSAFRVRAQFRWKLASISALGALAENRRIARITQNYAVSLSEFVRREYKTFLSRGTALLIATDCSQLPSKKLSDFTAAFLRKASGSGGRHANDPIADGALKAPA